MEAEGITTAAAAGQTESAAEPVVYNPFAPGFTDDPYAQYAALRAQGRVHRNPLGQRVLSHYDECFELLRLPGTSVGTPTPPTSSARSCPRTSPSTAEPGAHAAAPRPTRPHPPAAAHVNAFTVRRVERLRDRVRHLVAELLDDLERAAAGGEPVDLIARFAFPLPFTVISEMLGMPEGDRDQLRSWSRDMTNAIEPFNDEATLRRLIAAGVQMFGYLDEVIAWKRRNPADDLLSALIAAEEDGDRLTTEELRETVVLLYIAGHETTVNLIGNGTLALLRHRDQFERLVADPSLDANAVDELLRYDSPVQVSRRITTREVELAGETIPPGCFVLTLLGSSNRDETRWGPTADDLDLGREGANAHLSFGSGIHHCLGHALARLEGMEAVPALVRRFPRMELATDRPRWNGRIVLRGLESLPVTLAA